MDRSQHRAYKCIIYWPHHECFNFKRRTYLHKATLRNTSSATSRVRHLPQPTVLQRAPPCPRQYPPHDAFISHQVTRNMIDQYHQRRQYHAKRGMIDPRRRLGNNIASPRHPTKVTRNRFRHQLVLWFSGTV